MNKRRITLLMGVLIICNISLFIFSAFLDFDFNRTSVITEKILSKEINPRASTTVFNEDFESYVVGGDPTGWTVSENSNAYIEISTTQAHSGTKSAYIRDTSSFYETNCQKMFGSKITEGKITTHFYIDSMSGPDANSITFVMAGDDDILNLHNNQYICVSVRVNQTLMARVRPNSDTKFFELTQVSFDTWHKLEVEFSVSSDTYYVYLDGTLVSSALDLDGCTGIDRVAFMTQYDVLGEWYVDDIMLESGPSLDNSWALVHTLTVNDPTSDNFDSNFDYNCIEDGIFRIIMENSDGTPDGYFVVREKTSISKFNVKLSMGEFNSYNRGLCSSQFSMSTGISYSQIDVNISSTWGLITIAVDFHVDSVTSDNAGPDKLFIYYQSDYTLNLTDATMMQEYDLSMSSNNEESHQITIQEAGEFLIVQDTESTFGGGSVYVLVNDHFEFAYGYDQSDPAYGTVKFNVSAGVHNVKLIFGDCYFGDNTGTLEYSIYYKSNQYQEDDTDGDEFQLNVVWDKSTAGGQALSIIDINNDGSFEILTASSSNVLNVYSLTGTILWTKTLDYAARKIFEVNVDGDSNLEIAILTTSGHPNYYGSLYVLDNDGTELWSKLGIGAWDAAPLDRDGDGINEIAVIGLLTSMAYVYSSTGSVIWSYSSSTAGYGVTTGNFDDEPNDEVFFLFDLTGRLFNDNGNIVWQQSTRAFDIASADIDGDNKHEIIYPNVAGLGADTNLPVRVYEHDHTPKWSKTVANEAFACSAIYLQDRDDICVLIGGTSEIYLQSSTGADIWSYSGIGTTRTLKVIGKDIINDLTNEITILTGVALPHEMEDLLIFDSNGNLITTFEDVVDADISISNTGMRYLAISYKNGVLALLQGGESQKSITVTNPTSSSSWDTDSSYAITWSSTGSISSVKIELYAGAFLESTIISSTRNDGSYSWSIPSSTSNGENYRIKITDISNFSVYDYSSDFSILSIDTDGDGLSDSDEINVHGTDPNDSDTDDDDLSDNDEINIYFTDPNVVDTDGDVLSDGDEINIHRTDPNDFDTDGDGLSDGVEINTYSTDPNDSDTDNDDLNDGDEVIVHGTDPTSSDTDDDGFSDGEEIRKGYDPKSPLSNPLTIPVIIAVILVIVILALIIYMSTYGKKKISDRRSDKKVKKGREELERTKKMDNLLIKYKNVEIIIQEEDFSNAIMVLNEIIKEAKKEKFIEISNRAKKKLKNCKNLEKEKNKEEEAHRFENLIRKAKELVNDGKQEFTNESYQSAINHWEEAINVYTDATKKVPSSQQWEQIKEGQSILRENICNTYIESGNKHDIDAKKSHKNEKIQEAQDEWNKARKEFQAAIEYIEKEKLEIPCNKLENKINAIDINRKLLEIEKLCLKADNSLKRALSLKNKDLTEAIKITADAFPIYAKAQKEAGRRSEFKEFEEKIQDKIENAMNVQAELQNKMGELFDITPVTSTILLDENEKKGEDEKKARALSIKSGHELIGGQVRFKMALTNSTGTVLTNFKIQFDIPDALKWTTHEPNYERKGDSILIHRIGVNEKKTVSLFLDPINCLNGPINAIISYFDSRDRQQAVTMEPKIVSITCPMFFTDDEANLARVKHLQRNLKNRDKKVYAIRNLERSSEIFSLVLSVLGKHDIKLVDKEFSEKDRFGEAWYYGKTKYKKNTMVIYFILDGESKTFEIETVGNDAEQLTAFLAEVNKDLQEELVYHNFITSDEEFYDIHVSVLCGNCPLCAVSISTENIQKFKDGKTFTCEYCGSSLNNVE